jgi:hypothetical protein
MIPNRVGRPRKMISNSPMSLLAVFMTPSYLEIYIYHNRYTYLKARSSTSPTLAAAGISVIEMDFREEARHHEKNSLL